MSTNMNVIDELLAIISDELAEEINLFLVNGPLSDKQQLAVIQFLNRACVEGFECGRRDYESEQLSDKHTKWMQEFHKKLKNEPEAGRTPIEPTPGS